MSIEVHATAGAGPGTFRVHEPCGRLVRVPHGFNAQGECRVCLHSAACTPNHVLMAARNALWKGIVIGYGSAVVIAVGGMLVHRWLS